MPNDLSIELGVDLNEQDKLNVESKLNVLTKEAEVKVNFKSNIDVVIDKI